MHWLKERNRYYLIHICKISWVFTEEYAFPRGPHIDKWRMYLLDTVQYSFGKMSLSHGIYILVLETDEANHQSDMNTLSAGVEFQECHKPNKT